MQTLTARRWGIGLGMAAAALLLAAALSATSVRAQEADWGGDIPSSGVALLTWNGGTVDELIASAEANGFLSVFATSGGEFVGYIVGAPDFVNADFEALFTGEVDADTPFVVLIDEGAGPAPTPTATSTAEPTATATATETATATATATETSTPDGDDS